MVKTVFFPIPWNHLFSEVKWVRGGFKSIDLAIAVILVFSIFWGFHFRPQTCWNVDFHLFSMLFNFPIPCATSRSNHYVDKVGGYHKILICIWNPPNASPEVHPCRPFEPNHSLSSHSLPSRSPKENKKNQVQRKITKLIASARKW